MIGIFDGPRNSGPPKSGLVLWLKADAGVTLSGSNVTNWADASGNSNDFVQATSGKQPTLATGAINGLPAVAFNGSQWLTSGFNISGQKHVIFVRKITTLPSGSLQALFEFRGSGETAINLFTQGVGYFPTDFEHGVTGVTQSVGTTDALDTSWHVQEQSYDGTGPSTAAAYTAGLDGTAQTVTATTAVIGNAAGNLTALGALVDSTNSGGFPFFGDVAEVLVFDHTLSGGDILLVRAYLQNKYGI